jgi:uncharacterized protein
MFIELENVFNNEGTKFAFDYKVDLSGCEFGSGKPFKKPVRVSGEVGNYTGIVKLSAQALVQMNTQCDRCACDVEKQITIPVEHILVTLLNDEENDDFLLIEKTHFELDPLVTEDIFLELPAKILCKDDCRGLCSNCGENLNNGQCGCPKHVDPRLEALKQLLDK